MSYDYLSTNVEIDYNLARVCKVRVVKSEDSYAVIGDHDSVEKYVKAVNHA